MAYDMVRYERGQVWMIRDKSSYRASGHEQQKDRPWLILSVGKFNKSSGMITAVPITSRDKAVTVAQVQFYNDRDITNVIMCEQIKTFDYKSGEYVLEYMGQLSDKILEKVDVALSVHLGLHYSPVSLNMLYDSIEGIVKSIGHLQEEKSGDKFTDEDVVNFANKLKELATPKPVTATAESKVVGDRNILYANTVPATESKVASREAKVTGTYSAAAPSLKKNERIVWNLENCKSFLEDVKNLPMKEVMSRWGIEKKSRFYSTKQYVQGLMNRQKR